MRLPLAPAAEKYLSVARSPPQRSGADASRASNPAAPRLSHGFAALLPDSGRNYLGKLHNDWRATKLGVVVRRDRSA